MNDPNRPDTPDLPPSQPLGGDEAQRLMEVGLSGAPTRGRSAFTVPSAAELQARFPDLEILELVGQGGMGAVYRARQKRLDRIVALKVLPQELSEDAAFTERFVREARALAKLQHPHIVGVYEFGDKDGLFYLLLEYVDGVTLRQLMTTESLAPKDALAIVPQICDALQFAHDNGVVHRDVKPENILLDRAGHVKVTDFGLAKLANPTPADFTLTGTGQVMGTLHYMAPEQYRTPNDVDHRADIFSLGVVFYEMLTGDLPVGNFEKPSSAAALDARLDEIVMRALERQRDQRYQRAQDVEADVQTVIREPGRHGRRCGPRRVARPAPARVADDRPVSLWASWAWWVLLAAPVIGVLVYAFIYNTAAERGGYLGTVIGAMTGISAGLLAAALALIAIIRIRAVRGRLRGHRRSVVCLVLSLILCGVFTAHFVGEERSMQRSWYELQRRNRPQKPYVIPAGVDVVSNAPKADVTTIVQQIHLTWGRLQTRARNEEDGAVIGASTMITGSPNPPFPLDDAARAKIARRELGLGFMGKAEWPAPPWFFRIRRIEIDEWETAALVTLRHTHPGDDREIVFAMRKTQYYWVFDIKPVVVKENALGPLKSGDEDG